MQSATGVCFAVFKFHVAGHAEAVGGVDSGARMQRLTYTQHWRGMAENVPPLLVQPLHERDGVWWEQESTRMSATSDDRVAVWCSWPCSDYELSLVPRCYIQYLIIDSASKLRWVRGWLVRSLLDAGVALVSRVHL